MKCPMCQNDLELKGYTGTEVWTCPTCRCVVFEYIDVKSVKNMLQVIGIKQAKRPKEAK